MSSRCGHEFGLDEDEAVDPGLSSSSSGVVVAVDDVEDTLPGSALCGIMHVCEEGRAKIIESLLEIAAAVRLCATSGEFQISGRIS